MSLFDGEPVQASQATTHSRPRLVLPARLVTVRGTGLPSTDCLWATCNGSMAARGHNHYLCSDCGTWFELLPPQDLGVYVGDLAASAALGHGGEPARIGGT